VRVAALLVVAAAGLAPESFAAVYTCTDVQGRTVFQDVPCGAARGPAEIRAGKRPRSRAAKEPEQPLERSRVQAVLKRLHQAMTKRDVKAVTALLAEDVQVQWVFAKGRPGEPILDRGGYADYLRQVFARSDYVYERKSERVTLAKRKARATVTRSLREAVLVNGRLQVADVDERLTIEQDGRKLVVRSVKKTAALEARNSPSAGGVPSLQTSGRGGLAPVLLAQDNQYDEHDDPGGHRDVQH
jgi:Domain of unknown function (DUF4124)